MATKSAASPRQPPRCAGLCLNLDPDLNHLPECKTLRKHREKIYALHGPRAPQAAEGAPGQLHLPPWTATKFSDPPPALDIAGTLLLNSVAEIVVLSSGVDSLITLLNNTALVGALLLSASLGALGGFSSWNPASSFFSGSGPPPQYPVYGDVATLSLYLCLLFSLLNITCCTVLVVFVKSYAGSAATYRLLFTDEDGMCRRCHKNVNKDDKEAAFVVMMLKRFPVYGAPLIFLMVSIALLFLFAWSFMWCVAPGLCCSSPLTHPPTRPHRAACTHSHTSTHPTHVARTRTPPPPPSA